MTVANWMRLCTLFECHIIHLCQFLGLLCFPEFVINYYRQYQVCKCESL